VVTGLRPDTAEVYSGDFAQGLAEGHGCSLTSDGLYYEGQWAADRRHGFGFAADSAGHLRVGQWLLDRYMGERMSYTSERIYGIDISRYQHGKGKKKYPIVWNRLRIAHLGNNQKNAAGTVDYPVSFIFIKSTESTSIRNPFYAQDYLRARQHGIPIGAYHFFSYKTSGSAQAQYFIQNTLFRQGDLPPVLDIEPSHSQVAAMGGPQVLFRHVRAWLQAVERRTGVKPILYVSQMFVNRYLPEAPDLKRDYHVWIARYSEYKPDVRLAVWQLSPNGRVTGIHGEVDINVFNGYRTQWDEFLETATIK
jgi:lysozyme